MLTVLTALTLVVLAAVTILNGFHDASNAVGAAVRTRALTPGVAIIVVAVFTFLGALVASGLGASLVAHFDVAVHPGPDGPLPLLAGLIAAGGWGLFTWWKGQPSSSTHAVISGVAGASTATALITGGDLAGGASLLLRAVVVPLVLTTLLAPLLAFVLAAVFVWSMRSLAPKTVDRTGRAVQSIGTCTQALAHGLQDGQRSAAIAVTALASVGTGLPHTITPWVPAAAGALLAIGVLGGGWRITHTLSTRLVTLDPLRAGAANVSTAALLFVGAFTFHLPVSSTQAITGSLVGAGRYQRHPTVNWATARRIGGYWLATPVVCGLGAAVLALAASPLL